MNTVTNEQECDVESLKAENEALRAQLKETEAKGRVLMDISRDLKARVAQLEAAALSAVQIMPGGQAKADLRDAYDAEENSEAWLLRKQAEAVEAATKATEIKSATDDSKCYSPALRDYAQRLRQQADEAERAGGN